MNKPKVVLKDQQTYNPGEIAGRVAEIIQALGTDPSGRTVLVKPSFVYPSKAPVVKGIITQPELIVGVARALRDLGASRVMVAESSVIGPSRVSFQSVGILPLLKGLAEPVFLDEEDAIEVEVKDPFVQEKFRVPRIWLDADLYVSLPKIKTNMFAEVTLTIKNNLGMLRQRDRLVYHDYRLHKKLADLYKVRPPDLVVADCVVAGEGQGPLMADPVELGLLVGGDNAIAVDLTACHLTGYEPDEVEHLDLLIRAGYGPRDLEGVEIEGAGLLERARKFRRPDPGLKNLSPRIRVFQGKEFYCPSGCAGLVRGAVDAYIDLYGPDRIQPMNVIVGKPIQSVPADLDPDITLVLGDCAEKYRNRGEFVKGCCPRPLDIGMVIRRIMGPMSVEMSVVDVMRAYTAHNFWRMRRMIAGKPLAPIENHVTFMRAMKEHFIMMGLRKKNQNTP